MLKCPPNDRKQASSLTFEHVLRLLTISPSSADIVLQTFLQISNERRFPA
ncbi:MAG: hypothetical protein ACTS41_01030 [Candidatus Hodgkinia cicadicola]